MANTPPTTREPGVDNKIPGVQASRWIMIGILVAVVLAVVVFVMAGVVLTSGILARDWKPLTIAAQDGDTLLTLQDRQIHLQGLPWPGLPLVQSVQVGGWTGSASCPNPTIPIGGPGYVYINYLGNGIAKLTIGSDTISVTHRGCSLILNGIETPLPTDRPLELKRTGTGFVPAVPEDKQETIQDQR